MPTETVLQIEHSPGMLSERRAILEPLGYNVISVLGFTDALDGSLLRQPIGVVVIGHGASWVDRQDLIAHFREALPGVPIVALLRKSDLGFDGADYNCPGDNPPLWIKTLDQALARGRERRFSSRPE
jgi:DNA-binding NtrC family response regulator